MAMVAGFGKVLTKKLVSEFCRWYTKYPKFSELFKIAKDKSEMELLQEALYENSNIDD